MKPNQFKLTPSNFILRWLRGDDNRMPHVYFEPVYDIQKIAFGWDDRYLTRLEEIKPSQKAPSDTY